MKIYALNRQEVTVKRHFLKTKFLVNQWSVQTASNSQIAAFYTLLIVLLIVIVVFLLLLEIPSDHSPITSALYRKPSRKYFSTKESWCLKPLHLTETKNSTVFKSTVQLRLELNQNCWPNCLAKQLCIKRSRTSGFECLDIVDADDPTGCGGICRVGVDVCRQIHKHFKVYECVMVPKLQITCDTSRFQCGELCLDRRRKCDGVINCVDESDEHDCDMAIHM